MNEDKKINLINQTFLILGTLAVFFAGLLFGTSNYAFLALGLFMFVCGTILLSVRAEKETLKE